MVGIITHIPELRDEFAQQVIVTKHQDFSTVEVREGFGGIGGGDGASRFLQVANQ